MTSQVGTRLRLFREMKNKSVQQIADLLGVDERTYREVENGRRQLKLNEMLAIAEYLDIQPEALYKGEGDVFYFNKVSGGNGVGMNIIENQTNHPSETEILKSLVTVLDRLNTLLEVLARDSGNKR